MPDTDLSPQQRLQRIGALIRETREAIHQSPRSCARRAKIPLRRWLAYENGSAEPTLPDLELIAHTLHVPPHVLLGVLPPTFVHSDPPTDVKHWQRLRGHIIGARLKQARLSRGEGVAQVAEALGMKPLYVRRIEAGYQPPVSVLERLMQHYALSLDDLLDLGVKPVGDAQERLLQHARFDLLDDDLRRFVADPGAAPFLRLAMRLRALSPQQLSQIGNAILALTDGSSFVNSPPQTPQP